MFLTFASLCIFGLHSAGHFGSKKNAQKRTNLDGPQAIRAHHLSVPELNPFFANRISSGQQFPRVDFGQKVAFKTVDFLVDFSVDFFPKENGPKKSKRKSTKKSTAETKH